MSNSHPDHWSLSLRMAVMQLAVNDTVYLLDMLALPQRIPQSKLRSFIRDIFANNSTIKLGTLQILFLCYISHYNTVYM